MEAQRLRASQMRLPEGDSGVMQADDAVLPA
jgi:hypothetical protein